MQLPIKTLTKAKTKPHGNRQNFHWVSIIGYLKTNDNKHHGNTWLMFAKTARKNMKVLVEYYTTSENF